MSYRPGYWSIGKILGQLDIKWRYNCPSTHDDRDEQLIEAGADEILELLKADSPIFTPEMMKVIAPDRKYPYGWLVFIPVDN